MTVPFAVPTDLFPVEHRFLDLDGARIHFVDEGRGETLLLLHGNPAWSFLYRKMIAKLRGRLRCVALDYPGYGMSEAPPGYGYTPPGAQRRPRAVHRPTRPHGVPHAKGALVDPRLVGTWECAAPGVKQSSPARSTSPWLPSLHRSQTTRPQSASRRKVVPFVSMWARKAVGLRLLG